MNILFRIVEIVLLEQSAGFQRVATEANFSQMIRL